MMNKIEFMLPRYAEYTENFTGKIKKVIVLGFVASKDGIEAVIERPESNLLTSIKIEYLRML